MLCVGSCISENSNLYCHPVPCIAQTLQFVITDTKNETPGLDVVINKSRAIVEHYKHCTQARNSLSRWQKQVGVPQHRLIRNV
ncbi:hypothetical protein PR048_015321 [Dryococelus australis]|uniref:Uncharacterized protein n=1 Tax=Dryococelus australis TaxID=614101 RepID=A0ABQ9HGW1_9NEOP|nr:hypothetical protein PR048_015321 [Dryococelus australis]